MNEPLFKNRFVRDEQYAHELYLHYYLKTPLFVVLYVLFGIQTLISFSVSITSGLFALLCAAIIVLSVRILHSVNVKNTIARDRERANGNELLNELFVYSDRVELFMLGNKETLYFSNIKRAFETKNHIFLQTKARMVYIFKKDSFTLGNSEDFVKFLRDNGIKIQK